MLERTGTLSLRTTLCDGPWSCDKLSVPRGWPQGRRGFSVECRGGGGNRCFPSLCSSTVRVTIYILLESCPFNGRTVVSETFRNGGLQFHKSRRSKLGLSHTCIVALFPDMPDTMDRFTTTPRAGDQQDNYVTWAYLSLLYSVVPFFFCALPPKYKR